MNLGYLINDCPEISRQKLPQNFWEINSMEKKKQEACFDLLLLFKPHQIHFFKIGHEQIINTE